MTVKNVPQNAKQHVTAGPYSPVIEVKADSIVVISGQAAIAPDGQVVGKTITEQAEYALENCKKQLEYAGCTLEDVFKCNMYMTDLNQWDELNEVYKKFMPQPYPVRTVVGTRLLPGLLVEIEMWAGKVK